MKFGTGYPLIALKDAGAVRDFAQTYDGAGFDYITAAGHLLATPADRYEGRPQATYTGPYHDPFVLFSYLSALTTRLHFVTSILILPLYETAVVAKQGAELDFSAAAASSSALASAGRSRSTRPSARTSTAAVPASPSGRGPPQTHWSKPFFSFKGKFHDIDNMGLNRLPAKPIPVWFAPQRMKSPCAAPPNSPTAGCPWPTPRSRCRASSVPAPKPARDPRPCSS
jgi:hypothetical protein